MFCGVSIRLFDFGRFKLRSNVRFCGWVASVEYCQRVVICSVMKLISALTDLVFLVGLDFIVRFVPVFSWVIYFAFVMIWWCVIPWKLFLGVIWMEKVADLSSRDCFWSLMTILFDSFIFQMMKISSANYLSLYSFPSESPIDDVRMTFNWTEDGVNLSLLFLTMSSSVGNSNLLHSSNFFPCMKILSVVTFDLEQGLSCSSHV